MPACWIQTALLLVLTFAPACTSDEESGDATPSPTVSSTADATPGPEDTATPEATPSLEATPPREGAAQAGQYNLGDAVMFNRSSPKGVASGRCR